MAFPRERGGTQSIWGPIRGGSSRKGNFLRLQVNERGWISLAEVYKNGGENCHLRPRNRANSWILRLYKAEKAFYFCDWFLFKRQWIYSSWKRCKVLNKVWDRGTIFNRKCMKGVPFRQKWYIKGWTVEPYGIASPNNMCWAPPPPPWLLKFMKITTITETIRYSNNSRIIHYPRM